MTTMFSESSYTSQPSAPSLLARMFPALTFYSKVVCIVWRSSKSAKAGTYTADDWVKDSQDVARAAESVGAQFHLERLDVIHHLKTPCVFVGNHMSTLETFFLPGVIQPWLPVTFVIKRSLQNYPIFGPILRARDPIVLDRVNPREDLVTVLEQGADRLQRGMSVVIFPQSTRSTVFDRSKFNSIGIKLAKRAGVPIIPFALRTDFWSNGTLVKDFGPIRPDIPVRFRFGAPLRVTGNGKAEHVAVCDFVAATLAEWGMPELKEVPHATAETGQTGTTGEVGKSKKLSTGERQAPDSDRVS